MTASAKTLRFQRRFVNDGTVTGQPTLFAELGRVAVRVDLSDLSEDPVTLNALRMEDIAKANRNELDNAFIARAASVTTATVHRTSDPFTRQGSDLIPGFSPIVAQAIVAAEHAAAAPVFTAAPSRKGRRLSPALLLHISLKWRRSLQPG